jgi:hypothetical protein
MWGLCARFAAPGSVRQWIYDMHTALGTQVDMGYRLLETFAGAGLVPGEALNGEVIVGVGEDAVSRVVELIRSVLPAIVENRGRESVPRPSSDESTDSRAAAAGRGSV